MKKIGLLAVAIIMAFGTSTVKSQEVSVSAGADLVSSYVWRGLNLGGASAQPGISASWKGLTLGAWGSVNLSPASYEALKTDEFDLYLGYEVGNFSVLITDYAFPIFLKFPLDGYDYFDYKGSHTFEATLAYSFGESLPLSIAWNTNFAGFDDWNADGDNDFSTYVELGYSLSVSDINIDLALGATPWSGAYSDGFAVNNISIKASKEIKITDSFSLPAFTQLVVNPDAKTPYLIFGLSF